MGRRKKRTWSDEEKREICQQTAVAGVSVAQVDPPPLKWPAVALRKTEDRNGDEAAHARNSILPLWQVTNA